MSRGLGLPDFRSGYQVSYAVLVSHLGQTSGFAASQRFIQVNSLLFVFMRVVGTYCCELVTLCKTQGAFHMPPN